MQFAYPAGSKVLVFEELVSLMAITRDPVYTEVVDKLPLLHVMAASMPLLRSMPVALHNRKVRGSFLSLLLCHVGCGMSVRHT